ncbi:outer membrane protein assembly factor BamE [Endozoicomonas sp. SCSIO W0465]|uniref:outer membrane protein assembly factor BamE n=1 Tax=Endozoicomonas sp. SCSIO W0465 TaxID=2918516 RepID=UPI002074ED2F|nr:outer membrane protein assembly factor BamE [Endozoicomonas sp. SCSIO W0465]USE38950.1 outer membrane protein assembly factor BamE [Endozoicomonas sp. SCSIO W0465]
MTRTLLTLLSVTLLNFCLPFTTEVLANSPASEAPGANSIITVPVGSQSQQLRQTLALPEHGQTMDEVREMLGSASQTETIGEPAITRWYYPDQKLTVYFEGNRVLRSVVHNMP